MKTNIIYVLLITITLFNCKGNIEPKHKGEVEVDGFKVSKPIADFRFSNNNAPKISVHRGGKGILNYPENTLETLQYVNNRINGIYEIDVAKTKDGVLVLMHDNSIDRTTTGSGLIANLTYKELQTYNVVDDYGNKTKYKVPLFSEVLKWCKANNVVLTIDIKRSVPQKDVIEAVKAVNAENVSIIITYNLEQAKSAYALAPELLLSVSARNQEELNRLLNSNIPTQNMLAFTGTRLSNPSLFKQLHDKNILCMLGTLGNLDKQAEARGDGLYLKWMDDGIDIIATDRPFAVNNAINK
ncbi:glycerophosphodiester phosphodiesterase family protein [Winogradskyella immobilis]|uniref:Glycerophosphodiester phosphodiesterase family protein n=1 Tax=Winogradskyella immobilis TaxID=2816852 RepID=A0ABS8ENX7_9FLAO|nr:glycerophosphodiester phosphodiesterase family protein [Winogradskyella immobilis]MCC1484843.1 glycerophosphodiester phosphodiesterase family protein [Winogradskyella immobilis]MCG0016935.1 glycerophosphodiester phosphodiesterase family protein [Winogradskyella immobilis]